MEISSTPALLKPKQPPLLPVSLGLMIGGFFVTFGVVMPLARGGSLHFLDLVFWVIPLPFLLLPLLKPKWAVASLVALIFWMPGPIDHFWDVRASFYETADKMRVLSLLDWAFLLALFLPAKNRPKLRQLDVLILIFLFLLSGLSIFSVLSHTLTLDPGRIPALLTGLTFLRLLLVFLVISKFVHKPEDIQRVYIGLLVGLIGLLANTSVMYLRGGSTGGRLVAGTFGNNIFGVLLSIMIIFAGDYKGVVKKPWLKMFLTGLQLVCLVLMILSGTRMAIAVLGLSWAIQYFMRHKNPIRFLTQVSVFVLVFVLAVGILVRFSSSLNIGTDRVASLINIATGQASRAEYEYTFRTWAVRTVIWQYAWERLALQPWLGIGPGQWNYERTFSTSPHVVTPNGVYDSISDPHNGYVHIGLEYGLPALVIYGLFLIFTLWKGWHSLKRLRRLNYQNENPQIKPLFILFGGIFTAIIIILLGEITNAYITKIHLQLFLGSLLFTLLRADAVLKNATLPAETAPHA
ncbi:MAG TPA: O-antigen ligase family protein [Anaerolineales bacterium]|nr:O-antigen ligase family protein [Anaerolineales bacterium]